MEDAGGPEDGDGFEDIGGFGDDECDFDEAWGGLAEDVDSLGGGEDVLI